MTDKKPLRIGVLYEGVQMSDLVGIDVIGSCSTAYIDLGLSFAPEMAPFKPLSIPMDFLYISSSLTETSKMTPDAQVKASHTYANAPRDLDIIFIGGPNPMAATQESLEYLKEASKQTKYILTTCTGAMWLARSGVLDGKKATTNRFALPMCKQGLSKTEWLDQRWVIDDGHFEGAKIWTAGGAGCGIDMTIEFVKQMFDRRIVISGCAGLDFDFNGKGQFYSKPPVGIDAALDPTYEP